MDLNHAQRLKAMEDENGRLKPGGQREVCIRSFREEKLMVRRKTARMVRILSVVDSYTRECLALGTDSSFGSGRRTGVLERLIRERGRPESVRLNNGPELTSRRMLGWAEAWKVGLVHIQPGKPHAERACRVLPRPAA